MFQYSVSGFGIVIGSFAALVVAFIFYLLAWLMTTQNLQRPLTERPGEQSFQHCRNLLLVGRNTDHNLCWLNPDIHRLDICSHRLLLNENHTTTTTVNTYWLHHQQLSHPATQATRYCPNCGPPVDANATFCPHCGKQLPPA